MIHIYHGFLGSPDDFKFLDGENVRLHDLYQNEKTPTLTEDDSLIGYSLGGRFVMELASVCEFRLKKIVLINAHPGLSEEDELIERKHFETRILEKLRTMAREDFIEFWNRLPIFHADRPISVSPERFKASADLFQQYRLSGQKNFLPELIHFSQKVHFIIGLHDEKYYHLASTKLIPAGIKVTFLDGGHRLFQHPQALLKTLREEKIL
jgi:2-succinyl-6-hydroxy-2,4-cyclohexadiene-1-carboxylate synthase